MQREPYGDEGEVENKTVAEMDVSFLLSGLL
jgi:hypothetical protein